MGIFDVRLSTEDDETLCSIRISFLVLSSSDVEAYRDHDEDQCEGFDNTQKVGDCWMGRISTTSNSPILDKFERNLRRRVHLVENTTTV